MNQPVSVTTGRRDAMRRQTGGMGDKVGEADGMGDKAREADGMAVASFVMGLLGLLAFNVVLGPSAIALGGLALTRGSRRSGRAALGLALGVADLVVLAIVVSADHTVSWQLVR